MTSPKHESQINQELTELNKKIGEKEQEGADAEDYFKDLLSDNLIFRRASGKVASKNDFLDTLKEESPFSSRQAEDIAIKPMVDDRILVTLIVITTRKDNGFKQRFLNFRIFSCSDKGFILEFWYNYKEKDIQILHRNLTELEFSISREEIQKICFGKSTRQAILDLQERAGFEATGVVDEKTKAYIEWIKEIKDRADREYISSVLPVLPITTPENKDVLLSLYGEICNSLRMLTDVRFKLLGLVPTVSAAVLISLLSRSKPDEGLSPCSRIAISIFGLFITIGICMYDQRNTKLYNDLVRRGHRIEEELGIDTGQFRGRINPIPSWKNHSNATNLIYAVAVSGWLFVLLAIWQRWI